MTVWGMRNDGFLSLAEPLNMGGVGAMVPFVFEGWRGVEARLAFL